MIKKFKNSLMALGAIITLSLPMLVPAVAHAAADPATNLQNGLCQGVNLQVGSACSPTDNAVATDKVNTLISDVINIFSIIVGVIAVIMIIVGGLMYITSSGDSTKVTNAKNTIMYALIGLVVVALSQFIVRYVLTKFTTTT